MQRGRFRAGAWQGAARRLLSRNGGPPPSLGRLPIDRPGGPVRIPLEAVRAVTVGNLSQVQDHRITCSLGRSAHVVRFLEGGELRYACDHVGRLTELSSVGLSSTVTDDCTVVLTPLPSEDFEG